MLSTIVAIAAFAPPAARTSPHAARSVVQPLRAAQPLCKVWDPDDKVIYVDGNNLMMQRKVTKGREALCGKLEDIQKGQVVVVFDGRKGEAATETETDGGHMRVVVTKGGDEETGAARVTADEWILQDMRRQRAAVSERIEVVTADKELRRKASDVHKNVKLINPVKWWRRYLPRLKGLKSDYSNAPATDDE